MLFRQCVRMISAAAIFALGGTPSLADRIGDYEANETGIYFFIDVDEEYVKFSCEFSENFSSDYLQIFVPLKQATLHAATAEQDRADESYPGYTNYSVERFALYLSFTTKAKKGQHPIDDEYIVRLEKMTYANDMNYDGEYVWGSRFSMSAANAKTLIEVLRTSPKAVLRINSWNKTLVEYPLPDNGKSAAFESYKSSPCWSVQNR